MTTITALPTPPTRSDPANFASRADTFLAALPQFQTEANAVASEMNTALTNATAQVGLATTQATNAAASAVQANNFATAAANSATAAGAASGATVWVSGTTYSIGDCRWSPATYLTYRRKTAGAGTTDPSLDSGNWALLSSPAVLPVTVVSSNFNAYPGNHYVITTSVVGTFPSSANLNDTIMITELSGTGTSTLNPNGLKFNADATVMTLNSNGFIQKQFIYSGATKGWI